MQCHQTPCQPAHSQGIPVHQRIFQQWGDCVDIVLAHLPDVLEEKGERFQNSVLDVQFRNTVLVHESRDDGEGGAGFCNDGNGYCGADTILPLLDLEIVEESSQHILRSGERGGERERGRGRERGREREREGEGERERGRERGRERERETLHSTPTFHSYTILHNYDAK